MTSAFKKAWAGKARPVNSTPRRHQVAALCCKTTDAGLKVLLITSRGTGRWVLPKGWPMDGLSDAEAALQEAWEEAGLKKAKIGEAAIGHYDYDKELDDGSSVPVRVQVYLAEAKTLSTAFPEAHERRRKWVKPAKAARMVDEPKLKKLLRAL